MNKNMNKKTKVTKQRKPVDQRIKTIKSDMASLRSCIKTMSLSIDRQANLLRVLTDDVHRIRGVSDQLPKFSDSDQYLEFMIKKSKDLYGFKWNE